MCVCTCTCTHTCTHIIYVVVRVSYYLRFGTLLTRPTHHIDDSPHKRTSIVPSHAHHSRRITIPHAVCHMTAVSTMLVVRCIPAHAGRVKQLHLATIIGRHSQTALRTRLARVYVRQITTVRPASNRLPRQWTRVGRKHHVLKQIVVTLSLPSLHAPKQNLTRTIV